MEGAGCSCLLLGICQREGRRHRKEYLPIQTCLKFSELKMKIVAVLTRPLEKYERKGDEYQRRITLVAVFWQEKKLFRLGQLVWKMSFEQVDIQASGPTSPGWISSTRWPPFGYRPSLAMSHSYSRSPATPDRLSLGQCTSSTQRRL